MATCFGIYQENMQMESPNEKITRKTQVHICQMKVKNWIICVRDRGEWKEVVEKTKIFCD
jgi:hypothetical protein